MSRTVDDVVGEDIGLSLRVYQLRALTLFVMRSHVYARSFKDFPLMILFCAISLLFIQRNVIKCVQRGEKATSLTV